MPYSRILLVFHFKYSSVDVLIPSFLTISFPILPSLENICLFSKSVSLFLFVIVMKLRHRNDNELFQRSERFRILGLLPVFWSTPNNILYLRVIKSWHREQEGLRKLDQKIIGRTLRVSQVQAAFLGQGVVQKLGLTESDLAIFSVRPNSMQRQSPCSCRT